MPGRHSAFTRSQLSRRTAPGLPTSKGELQGTAAQLKGDLGRVGRCTAARLAYRLLDDLRERRCEPIWSPTEDARIPDPPAPAHVYPSLGASSADGGAPAPEPHRSICRSAERTQSLLAGWTRDNRIGILVPTRNGGQSTRSGPGGRAAQLTPKAESSRLDARQQADLLPGFHGGDQIGLEVVPAEGGRRTGAARGGYNERAGNQR